MKRLAASAVATVIVCGVVLAHDAEHTAVSVTFARDGSFVIDVANDPNWLLLRLESFAALEAGATARDRRRLDPPSALERDARLRALAPLFVDRIVFFVDGHEIRPASAEYLPPPPQGPGGLRTARRVSPPWASVRRGPLLRWYYGMVVDPYPLVINRADGTTLNEWIVAGRGMERRDRSDRTIRDAVAARDRTAIRAPGISQVLPRGVPHALVHRRSVPAHLRVRSLALQFGVFAIASAIAIWLAATTSCPSRRRLPLGSSSCRSSMSSSRTCMTTELKPWRVPLVFVFGLAHGAAFGLAVKQLSLTRSEMPLALVCVHRRRGGSASDRGALVAILTRSRSV